MQSLFDDVQRSAVFSPCGQYRYRLTVRWAAGPLLGWLMLNPSAADQYQDDPTLRRVRQFTAEAGYGGCTVANLFAYISPYPSALFAAPDPYGPDYQAHMQAILAACPEVVCGWGAKGAPGLTDEVRALLHPHSNKLRCLGTTKGGAPRHPLYVKGGTPLVAYLLG